MATDDALARLVVHDYQQYVQAYEDTPGVEIRDIGGIRLRFARGIDDDYLSASRVRRCQPA